MWVSFLCSPPSLMTYPISVEVVIGSALPSLLIIFPFNKYLLTSCLGGPVGTRPFPVKFVYNHIHFLFVFFPKCLCCVWIVCIILKHLVVSLSENFFGCVYSLIFDQRINWTGKLGQIFGNSSVLHFQFSDDKGSNGELFRKPGDATHGVCTRIFYYYQLVGLF